MSKSLGSITAKQAQAREQTAELAKMLKLGEADVARRLAAAGPDVVVRDVFRREWTDAIGDLPVSNARDLKLGPEISQLIDHPPQAVGRRLSGAHGRTLVRNLFTEKWPKAGQLPAGVLEGLEGYVLIEEIDGAGMSETLRAREVSTGDEVFVKRASASSTEAANLEREARIYEKLGRAEVEHVVRVREFVRGPTWIYLVTDLADGGDLHTHVEKRGPFAGAERSRVARQIFHGVRELHALGIVHRDLKPQNILLAKGAWKIADFGIAKNTVRMQTKQTFKGAGTLIYCAPEQLEGVQAHPSADIYSLGQLLTFLSVGSLKRTELSKPWLELVERLTAKQPAKRPTIDEALAALPKR